MEFSCFPKTLVFYKTNLNESELKWKESVEPAGFDSEKGKESSEPENLNSNKGSQPTTSSKQMRCRCKTLNIVDGNTLMAKCSECQEILCFECSVNCRLK